MWGVSGLDLNSSAPQNYCPRMWGVVMSCRSQPPLHFSQHSITPLQAIFSLINTSSSGAELSLLKAAVTCQCYRLCTSIDPCWVMVQCSVDPQTSSLKTPPWYVISHCRNSAFSTNVRLTLKSFPKQPLGAGLVGARFLGVGASCWSLP